VAEHRPVSLERGKRQTAWARTLAIRELLPPGSWWDDVYLVASEAPYGAGQGTVAVLNRIVGAVAAGLPARLRAPERCWVVRPDEWKNWLGIQGKPTSEDLRRLPVVGFSPSLPGSQDARDALCLACFARELNERAVRASA
jgi:hypothetical protein